MKKVTLYRYTREDGGVTVTPNRPKTAGYTIKHRLIADEGMTLTMLIRSMDGAKLPTKWKKLSRNQNRICIIIGKLIYTLFRRARKVNNN